jgi:hypothetical protein
MQAMHAYHALYLHFMHRKLLSGSDEVRQYAEHRYVTPARARGEARFTITVGEVHKGLALENRVPLVCAALRSKKFLDQNGLRLVSQSGPPSGQSTTVTFTYEFQPSTTEKHGSALIGLRGMARDIFHVLGGGEEFIRAQRDAFLGPGVRRRSHK